MARLGKKRRASVPEVVPVETSSTYSEEVLSPKSEPEQSAPAEQEKENVVEDTNLGSWEATPEGEEQPQEAVHTNLAEVAENEGEQVEVKAEGEDAPAADPKPESPSVSEFPEGSIVKMIKTDDKNNFGKVTGVERKAAGEYLTVRLTHYANAKPRGEKEKTVTVRTTSVELSEIPAEDSASE